MASSAWTATRDELVRELAKARARHSLAQAQLEAERALTEAAKERRRRWDRENQRKHRERQKAKHLEAAAQAARELEDAVNSTPPDPNAAQHRADLLAALKEKP